METALKQATQKIGPEVRFSVTAEEVEVRGKARYSELRSWYSDMKARGVIADERIGVSFPGKHLMRNLKLGGGGAAVDVKDSLLTTEVDVTQFLRGSVSSPEIDQDYLDDFSATALVGKRRRELCLWLEALLWRYPNNLLKDSKNSVFLSNHKVNGIGIASEQSSVSLIVESAPPPYTSVPRIEPSPPPYTPAPEPAPPPYTHSTSQDTSRILTSPPKIPQKSQHVSPPPLPRPLSENTKAQLTAQLQTPKVELPSWLPRYEVLFPAGWATLPSEVIRIEESVDEGAIGKVYIPLSLSSYSHRLNSHPPMLYLLYFLQTFRGRLLKPPCEVCKVQEKKCFGSTLGLRTSFVSSWISAVQSCSHVTVKVTNAASKRHMDNLRKEVEALTTCASPMVVQYLSCFLQPKTSPISGFHSLHSAWLAYEWGTPLNHALSSAKTGLSEEVVLSVLACAVLALRHIHSKGFLYLNLHVGSVTMHASGIAKLSDFTCAHNMSSSSGSSSSDRGRNGKVSNIGMKHHYMSPELASAVLSETSCELRRQMAIPGTPSEQADVWALGILGYECVQCLPPHARSSSNECLMRIASSSAPTLRLSKRERRSLTQSSRSDAASSRSRASRSLGPRMQRADRRATTSSVSPSRSKDNDSEVIHLTLELLLVVKVEDRPSITDILSAKTSLKSTADGIDRWGYSKALRDFISELPMSSNGVSNDRMPSSLSSTGASSTGLKSSSGVSMRRSAKNEETIKEEVDPDIKNKALITSDFEF